jgi:hypothetical protein
MRVLIPFLLLISCAAAQPVPRNRLTFNGGWSRQIGDSPEDAPGFGLSYGYRIHKYIEPEVGVFAALQPSSVMSSAHYTIDPDDRFVWITWGVRFIAPLNLERFEFSGGGGGLYEKYSVSDPLIEPPLMPYEGWGGYFVGSASVALDRNKRFWLGATPRLFLANPGDRRDRWFQISADFSVRFGGR